MKADNWIAMLINIILVLVIVLILQSCGSTDIYDPCERMTTDMDITLCTGDVNPADPMEDEDQYIWIERD